MRLFVAGAALVALTGCGFSPLGGPDQGEVDDAAAQTCAEVRAGIAAFNDRDYTGTVEHFVKAKPFARRYADLSDEKVADDLLEAVEYYAALPPRRYREAFAESRQFLKYQQITLGQCEVGAST